MVNNIFYIYRWIRLDTNTPFYVGKVKGINKETLQDLCFESAHKCAEFFGTKHQMISGICLGKRKPMNDWVLTYLMEEAA